MRSGVEGEKRARTLEHPDQGDTRLETVLAALADPVQRRIACHLNACLEDHSCVELDLPVSKSTATHHFRVLCEAVFTAQNIETASSAEDS